MSSLRSRSQMPILALALAFMASPLAGSASAGDNPANSGLLETCTVCHGKDGNNATALMPKLAGQKGTYLEVQLQAFKSGSRKSDAMSAISQSLSGRQISDLADYFSRQRVRPDDNVDRRLAAAGERIFFAGGRGTPSCAACHTSRGGGFGRMGMGRMGMGMGHMGMMGNVADIPNIAGQHAGYVAQQLDAFASGARPASVMGTIARSLRKEDRKAVAAYIATLY